MALRRISIILACLPVAAASAQCISPDLTESDFAHVLPSLGLKMDDPAAATLRLLVADQQDVLDRLCAALDQEQRLALGRTPELAEQSARAAARTQAQQAWHAALRTYTRAKQAIGGRAHLPEVQAEVRAAREAAEAAKAALDALPIPETAEGLAWSSESLEALAAAAARLTAEARTTGAQLEEDAVLVLNDDQVQAWNAAVRAGRRRTALPLGEHPLTRLDAIGFLQTLELEPTLRLGVQIDLDAEARLHDLLGERSQLLATLKPFIWRRATSGRLEEAAAAALQLADVDARVGEASHRFIEVALHQLPEHEQASARQAWTALAFPGMARPTSVEQLVELGMRRTAPESYDTLARALAEYQQERAPLRLQHQQAQWWHGPRESAVALALQAGTLPDDWADRHAEALATRDRLVQHEMRWYKIIADLLEGMSFEVPLHPDWVKAQPIPAPGASPDPGSAEGTVIDAPPLDAPTPLPPVDPPTPEDD